MPDWWGKGSPCGRSPGRRASQGHFGAVVAEGHGMGHQFKAVIQGTVVLAVELGLALVGDGQEAAGVVAVLAGLVDLQLHAEIKGPSPQKQGDGR